MVPQARRETFPLTVENGAHSNLELKARIRSTEEACARAQSLGAQFQGILVQRDTYFHVPTGRLKLREINDAGAEIIFYQRDDRTAVRTSHYIRSAVSEPATLMRALDLCLGTRVVVEKRRQLYLYENARIHIDEVGGLGCFLEFEIVDGEEGASESLMQLLRTSFGIGDIDTVKGSYSDLMLAETPQNST